MVDYLTYYYNRETKPFRVLSELPDEEAIGIMKELYVRNGRSLLFERFRDPVSYLQMRRQTEKWVRSAFVDKGGRPIDQHPLSAVLGESRWIEAHAPDPATHGEIRIPLSLFSEDEVSFTYPDSMVSWWLMNEQPTEYYHPEYHGNVFTLVEVLSMIREGRLPEGDIDQYLPPGTGGYIEAQIWNRQPLEAYIRTMAL